MTLHYHTMKLIGKFAVDRGSFLTGGGTIATLRFRANRAGRTNIVVKNIEATNLEDEIRPRDVSTSITVNPKSTPTPTVNPTPTPTPTSKPTPKPTAIPTKPPVIMPTPTPTPTQNNNQGNNNNQGGNNNNSGNNQVSNNQGNNQGSSTNVGNNGNVNQSGETENQEQAPEVTPSGNIEQPLAPTLSPTVTPDDNDFENVSGKLNLTKKEQSSDMQVIIYILFVILGVTVSATIILFCYVKIRNKNIKKLGGRI